MNNSGCQAGIFRCLLLMLISMLVAGSVLADSVDVPGDVLPVIEDSSENGASDDEVTEDLKPEEVTKTAVLRVKVYQKSEDDKPIKDAEVKVIYDEMNEFKETTNKAGVAVLLNLPYGKADINVISSGMLLGREEVLLDEPEKTRTFHLEPYPMAKE